MHQIAEAARRLKCSRVWVYRLIERGELATSTIGQVRFVIEDSRFRALQKERAKGQTRADA